MSTAYNYKYIFKFIVIGNMGTGKSSILRRFTEQVFSEKTSHTIGVEFGTSIIQVDEAKIKLQIWDTAGQERFRSVTQSYYRTAIGAILVYDISNRDSFLQLESWYRSAKELAAPKCVFAMIGNKSDCAKQRQVSTQEAKDYAKKHDIMFFETSAKTGVHIPEVFDAIAKRVVDLINSEAIDVDNPNFGVQLKAPRGATNKSIITPTQSTDYFWQRKCC